MRFFLNAMTCKTSVNFFNLRSKFSTMCLTHKSTSSGTVASDHSGSSAMMRRIFLMSAAGLSFADVSGDGTRPPWVLILLLPPLLWLKPDVPEMGLEPAALAVANPSSAVA